MLRPKAQYRQDLRDRKAISTAPHPTNPFAGSGERATEQAQPKEPTKRPTIPSGSDGLLEWCTKHMNYAWGPKSARDIVEAWFSHWRGRADKPAQVTKRLKTHHVDRVSKWLERQVEAGRVEHFDSDGKWGAKRYLTVDGERLRQRGAKVV